MQYLSTARRSPGREIFFECTRLRGSGKQGIIKPDADGCYTQVIGGLNAYNSMEDFYDLEAGVRFFQQQSSFNRRINRGVLRAEYGHPKMPMGQKDKYDYGIRYTRIEETMVCGTWRKIWLSPEKLKDERGRTIVPVMGTIYPSGPYRESLIHAFESPGEQVCFSIRSLTKDYPRGDGTYIKKLVDIITFDYVNEPGIWNAEKLLTPSIESIEQIRVDGMKFLDRLNEIPSISAESFDIIHVRENLSALIEEERKQQAQRSNIIFSRW